MKARLPALIAGSFVAVLLAATLPLVLLAGSTEVMCGAAGGKPSMAAIKATIRHLESGDDYSAQSPGSTASGAYQFLDSTWAGFGGYTRAYLAPPGVQDAKAVEHITGILAAHGNDPAAVPVAWYIGHVPAPGSSEWDTVPAPDAGNRLTPRQYQQKWMEIYKAIPGNGSAPGSQGSLAPGAPSDCLAGELIISGDYALPVERHWYEEHPEWFSAPHHDYPAIDIPVPTGTPIFSVTSGVVVSVTSSGACGIGVVINGHDGAQYTYCHGLQGSHAVSTGESVGPGELLMLSASTGNSSGPHLHLAIRADGSARCPQTLIDSVSQGLSTAPGLLPTSGCTT